MPDSTAKCRYNTPQRRTSSNVHPPWLSNPPQREVFVPKRRPLWSHPPRCGANKALEVFPSAASALALASNAAVRALKCQDDPDMDAVTPFQHNPSSVQLVSIDCAPRFRAVQCQSIANFLVSMACGFGLFP
jgi:hypothetical protein